MEVRSVAILGWVSSHHHIKCSRRLFLNRSASWFEEYYLCKRDTILDKFSDFSRLARVLMGKSIGLVLGGGGARGAAHVGVIKAMIDAGIPIDMVGGTSIGECHFLIPKCLIRHIDSRQTCLNYAHFKSCQLLLFFRFLYGSVMV